MTNYVTTAIACGAIIWLMSLVASLEERLDVVERDLQHVERNVAHHEHELRDIWRKEMETGQPSGDIVGEPGR